MKGIVFDKNYPALPKEYDALFKRITKTCYYGPNRSYVYNNISRPLAEYAAEKFSETHKAYSLNRLNHITAGQVEVNVCSLILATIYLDRLKDSDPEYVRKITPTELFLVSMMVSTKMCWDYDANIDANDWAEYGELTVDQIKKIELEFLTALNWRAYVSPNDFYQKLRELEISLAQKQSKMRGWLTYTELEMLFPNFKILKEFIACQIVMAISYTIGVLTILSAFQFASLVPGNSLYSKSLTTTSTNLESASATTSNLLIYDSSSCSTRHTNTSDSLECDTTENDLDAMILSENVTNEIGPGSDAKQFTSSSEIKFYTPHYVIDYNEYLPSNMLRRNIVDFFTRDNNIVALQHHNKKFNFVTQLKFF